jgi:phosphatidylglycerophosphate synthase
MQRYRSILEAYQSYREERLSLEVATDLGHVVLYRPLSIGMGWLLARGTTTPTTVSVIGGLSIPAMLASASLLKPDLALPAVCILAYLGGLLDCVDGDLARASGQSSRLGGYIDFQIDMARWAAFYASFGMAIDRSAAADPGAGASTIGLQIGWIVLALAAAWLRMYARSARDFLAAYGPTPGSDASVAEPLAARPRHWIYRAAFTVLIGIDGFLPFLFLACWAAGVPWLAVVLVLVLAILDVIDTQLAAVKALT